MRSGIMDQLLRQEIKDFLTASITPKVPRRCETCDKMMDHSMMTFIYDGETWDVRLPFCSG